MGIPTVLMVAEKPSLAQAIAKILSNEQANSRRSVSATCPVWEYQGVFFGKPARFKVTSVAGHVYTCDFPKEYNNWDSVEPVTLFDAPTLKLEANPKSHICKHLEVESKGVEYLVLWLDCDREGENICFEVIEVTKKNLTRTTNANGSKRKNIYRAKFSAITSTDIKKAMSKLISPNRDEARAVDVRQELDLKIGCAFTRYQTRYFQGKYGNLDSNLVSFGPCQTPTLALCVKRHDDILSFVPQSFWTLQAQISAGGPLTLAGERGRIFDRKKAVDISENLKNMKEARVIKVTTERKSVSRPHALNTVELLKGASVGLGIGPHETMQIAERLYIQGYISYPRTETSKYPPNFDLKAVLQTQTEHPLWGQDARMLLKEGFSTPEGGHDAGDHPPITPMSMATEYELGGDSWRLYDYITRYFIGTLLPNMKYLKTSVLFEIGHEKFSCTGKRVITPGFTSVMHWKTLQDENISTEIQEGKTFPVNSVAAKEGKTTPPEYLTESDVIGLMEKHGIGTDASMAVHISNICQRNYVQVQGAKRYLVPSNLGIVLIHGYQKIDPELALPTLRSNMEAKISLIATGKADYLQVLKEVKEVFREKFQSFLSKIEKMDELFEATFSPLASSGKPFSKCGKCRRYMHYISLRPARLHCRTCNETYSLPPNGNIKLYKELTCPIDNFELVLFTTGSKGKGYPVCPNCFNNPPFENVASGMGCNNCPHPTCPHSLTVNAITGCPDESCQGVMVLDGTSAPRWKLGCNTCNLVTNFADSVHQVTLDENLCEECTARLVTVSFQKKEGRPDITGCIVCDDEIDILIETKFARTGRYRGRGGRRGRGRGRGRGKGRGRGRGGGGGRRGGRDMEPSGKPSAMSLSDYF